MTALTRISGLDGLNAAPLLWGLLNGRAAGPDLEITLRSPAASADALATGNADVALIPSIELQRIPGIEPVPGLCVAARRAVRSVVLVSRRPLPAVRSVAVDETSRTSLTLLRILLDRKFGVSPSLVSRPPALDDMLARHDAALLIADAALQADVTGYEVRDLAREWSTWTGLPFVFAVWAARPGFDATRIAPRLLDSRTEGLEHLPGIVQRESARLGGLDPAGLTTYLGELLHYTLSEEEERSLQLFFAEARRLPGIFTGAAPAALQERRA